MDHAADRADTPTFSPCDVVLALVRAADAGDPFAFTPEEQAYVRLLEGGAARSAGFPWGEPALDRLAAIQRERADPAAAAWLGEALRAFLRKLGWERDEERIREALDAGQPVHITLRLGAAELFALPWELVPLGASGRPLGGIPGCLLRYEWPETATARPRPDPPPEGGRIVVAWSAAGGVVPADQHLQAIRRACRAGFHSFDERDVVPHASLGRLQQALRAAPVAVLHLLCHGGGLDAEGESYGLILDADGSGEREGVDGRALQMVLAEHAGSLRLVVLSACYSGAPGALDSRLGSVAQALHRAGVPAVVASRYPLATDASVELTEVLYRELLAEARSLEEAFVAARARLCDRPARAGWASLQLYARGDDGPDHRPVVRRPYRGLLPFQEEHARDFFGRDAEVREAVEDLAGLARDTARPRFVFVTGASGTGKSSLVMAGVVPALKARDGRWAAAVMRPQNGWKAALLEALAARTEAGAPLLVVVDQFEEVFTVMADKADREAFIGELWRLAGDPGSGVSVIATLRVDFLARCGEIRLGGGDHTLEDVAYDERHRVFVHRMKAEPLRTIIERPALRLGLALEEGLAEQMLAEAGEEPGALPLLQYTLDQLWQRREGRLLTWEHYRALGGAGGALERRADAILEGMDAARKRAARRLLVQLVTLDSDARLDRRRRVPLDKLRRGPAADADAFQEALHALVRERLLVLSGGGDRPALSGTDAGPASRASYAGQGSPIVEVAHEQLIRSWKVLRTWVREDRHMLADLQQLERWVEEARGFPRYVLDSDRLGHAREMLKRYPDDVGDAARQLIARSEAAAARSRRWTRGVAIGGVGAAVVMGGLAAVALDRQDFAEMQAEAARDASLMAGARELLALGQSGSAMTLLLNVRHPERMRGWATVAYESLPAPRVTLRGHWAGVYFARYSPDGKHIVTASYDDTVRLWSADGSGDPISVGRVNAASTRPPTPSYLPPSSAPSYLPPSFPESPAGSGVILSPASTGPASTPVSSQVPPRKGPPRKVAPPDRPADGPPQDASPAEAPPQDATPAEAPPPGPLDGRDAPILTALPRGAAGYIPAAFSADGKRLVTAWNDGTARVWSMDDLKNPVVLEDHKGMVLSVAISRDGKRVVTTSEDHTARVWRAEGGRPTAVLDHRGEGILSAAFSRDGERIFTISDRGTATVWRVDGAPELTIPPGSPVPPSEGAFSPDGKRFLVQCDGGDACMWSVEPPSGRMLFKRGGGQVFPTSFSPDGARIAFTNGGSIMITNADGSGASNVFGTSTHVILSLAFSPEGKLLVTGSQDETARVWSTDDLQPPVMLQGHDGHVQSAAFSPGGDRVVTASFDRTVRVWSARNEACEATLLSLDKGRLHAASPDGRRLVSLSESGTARVWSADGSGGAPVRTGHTQFPLRSVFSPDGTRVVTLFPDSTASVWSVDGSSEPVLLQWEPEHDSPGSPHLWSAAFSPDGTRVAIASRGATARVWSAERPGKPLVVVKHDAPVNSAVFSSDGKRIITASDDSTARIWSADTGAQLDSIQHPAPVLYAALSRDGQRVVTATRLNVVHVWSVQGRRQLTPVLSGHTGSVLYAAFSPDGTRIVTASSDETARVWDASSSLDPLVLRTHSKILSAAFTPDGKRVVTVSADNIARVWPVSVDTIQQALRRAADPCLSPTLRQTYLNEYVPEGDEDPYRCQPAQAGR